MLSRLRCGLLTLALVTIAFGYGLAVMRYEFFPYRTLRYLWHSALGADNQAFSSLYLHRVSFFEELGMPADTVMLGDSLTEGAQWHELFPNYAIVNRGIAGDTTLGVLNRLAGFTRTGAKKVFIMIGFNDLNIGFPVNDVKANYQTIIKRLLAQGTQPYVQSTLYAGGESAYLNPEVAALNTALQTYAAERGVAFIDLNAQLAPKGVLEPTFTYDGIHLNGAGYAVWQQTLRNYLP